MESQVRKNYLCPPPQPYLSVILPTFNRAKTLMRMVESVLSQSFGDFELLIIDDGSTDETSLLLREIQDKRIKIITKENGGVSSARNSGLQQARGRYVTFVDSDDYLLPGFFEDIYRHSKEEKYDIVIYPMRTISKKGICDGELFYDCRNYLERYPAELDGETLVKYFCLLYGNSGACAKVFSRSLLEKHQIFYPLNIFYGEDMVFNLKAYVVASKILLRDQYFYVYAIFHNHYLARVKSAYWQIQNLLIGHQEISRAFSHHQELLVDLNTNTLNHILGKYALALFTCPRDEIDWKMEQIFSLPHHLINQKRLKYLEILSSKHSRIIKIIWLYCWVLKKDILPWKNKILLGMKKLILWIFPHFLYQFLKKVYRKVKNYLK